MSKYVDWEFVVIMLLACIFIVATYGEPDLLDLLERWVAHTMQQYPESTP